MKEFDPKPFRNKDGRLRVLVVYKKSRLEFYAERYSGGVVKKMVEQADPVQGYYEEAHQAHMATFEHIESVLEENEVAWETTYRGEVTPELTRDHVIVTIGGDGTVLHAAHNILSNSPLLGVNSDPLHSVGSLCATDAAGFAKTFASLLKGALPTVQVPRIGVAIDGKPMRYVAMNEFLIAHANPAAMSRLFLETDGRSVAHKCSGVWVSAAAGSTGAIGSSGGMWQPLSDTRLQVQVREPYFAEKTLPDLLSFFVPDSDVLAITCKMTGAKLFCDGPHVGEPIPINSKLLFCGGYMPLSLFVTKDLEKKRERIVKLREKYHHVTHETPKVKKAEKISGVSL
jgi:NAD+ kinase